MSYVVIKFVTDAVTNMSKKKRQGSSPSKIVTDTVTPASKKRNTFQNQIPPDT
ncbi:hypothetical protein KDA_48210 [Dictyobacter alpinus]|uniref:Uncharacterized protein n=1 Tax=Dictyobacter alpinus TaxID=2014873 RepID=A0A402BDJ1_9CHLR|nr:hypothetical protein KDA_48210 [Dictyobacter alpinus]